MELSLLNNQNYADWIRPKRRYAIWQRISICIYITDTDKMVSELEDPYILITDKKISNTQEILQY